MQFADKLTFNVLMNIVVHRGWEKRMIFSEQSFLAISGLCK